MLRFDEGKEVFFDTAESFSSEESFVDGEELGLCDIWSELKSVRERREKFLIKMGFTDDSSVDSLTLNELETMGIDRIVECSGAVTSSRVPFIEENLSCKRSESNGEANCIIEEAEHEWLEKFSVDVEKEMSDHPCSSLDHGSRKAHANAGDVSNKKMRNWWKNFLQKRMKNKVFDVSKVQKECEKTGELTRMEVQQNKKRYMEFTAVYAGQEIIAHKGLILTMKFSPDGKYLASGGEDGFIRIWSISSVDSPCVTSPCSSQSHRIEYTSFKRKKSRNASIVVPEKIFHINETPVHEFRGHTSDILDLAWSTSNHLLSSSKDNTVRLWQVGSNECLSVFLHSNYVTCVQFNPVDEKYFITGSVDGKVRIWGVPEKRVVNWADTRNIITAVCYQPNSKGFVAGSVSGTCHFFELSGSEVLLNAEVQISGKRKSSGNNITGIQFLANNSRKVMITSEDSKIRILDGLDIVHKYKGPTKSGSQTSASFTSTGQHIISVGEDSRVYVWNYDQPHIQASKAKRSARSCENFFFEGVSVALPWSGVGTEDKGTRLEESRDHQDSYLWARDTERFSLGNWLSMDISSKGSATWPEEKLPLYEIPSIELDNQRGNNYTNHLQELQHQNNSANCKSYSATWGLVIVTAGWDGMIRTFHNYGLPSKI